MKTQTEKFFYSSDLRTMNIDIADLLRYCRQSKSKSGKCRHIIVRKSMASKGINTFCFSMAFAITRAALSAGHSILDGRRSLAGRIFPSV